jgi:hypothetical protein
MAPATGNASNPAASSIERKIEVMTVSLSTRPPLHNSAATSVKRAKPRPALQHYAESFLPATIIDRGIVNLTRGDRRCSNSSPFRSANASASLGAKQSKRKLHKFVAVLVNLTMPKRRQNFVAGPASVGRAHGHRELGLARSCSCLKSIPPFVFQIRGTESIPP